MRVILLWAGLMLHCWMGAQPRADMSILVGGSAYLGDLTSHNLQPDTDNLNFSYGLSASLPIKYNWRVRAGVLYGTINGTDAYNTNLDFIKRGFSFTTRFLEPSTRLEWIPFAKKRFPTTGGYKNIVTPYFFAGIGMTSYQADTYYGIPGINGYSANIRADLLHKEKWTMVFPAGMGIQADLSPHTTLGIEFGWRKSMTDYLDGVAVAGNPDADDWYITGGLTLSYRWFQPDYDRDGFMDNEDKCPQAAGVDYTGGCPDADQDGIKDEEDLCPYQAGKERARGCPDSDFDLVPDFIDQCPEIPGHASGKGCPDTDGDGWIDVEDLCPDCPAKEGLSGCPDSDGDGVADFKDRCPHLPGTFDGNGCPFLDDDLDGIVNEEDQCPNEAGSLTLRGCPDTDADGIADHEDKCPTLPGDIAATGCPSVGENLRQQLAAITQAVQFETGSDQLKSGSQQKLDELVVILAENEWFNLHIAGHTDSQGNDNANLRLSESRAKACYDYLIKQGVPPVRMNHKGYGESQPIASNATAAGRKQNRRVAFELHVPLAE
ncbi:MAG: DUF6089 family protein [Saprospiraceae bacterium]